MLDALCLVAILINDVSLTYSSPILTQIWNIRLACMSLNIIGPIMGNDAVVEFRVQNVGIKYEL